jgi:CHAT domain-containing protein
MFRRIAASFVLLACLSWAGLANDGPSAALVAAGNVLLIQLKGDAESDAAVYRQVGIDRTEQLLVAVLKRGEEPSATLDEWSGLHRSLDALASLEIFRKNPGKAATYALMNEAWHRRNEQDYEAALACARRSLEWNRTAGLPVYLSLKAIGEDLRSLDRPVEALASFRAAENALADPVDNTSAVLEREIVQTLLAMGRRDEASASADRMMRQSAGAPPLYQAHARMARAEILVGRAEYAAALEMAESALAVTAGTPDATTASYEVAAQILAAVVEGVAGLSYDEALRLAELADREIPGLPVPVAPFARLAIRQRRRMAGDPDSVLREDAARVEAARKSGNRPALAESLKSLATSYASVNGIRQQAVVLEEAADVDRSLFPSGIPTDPASQNSHLNLLNNLGEAYLELDQAGAANRAFERVLKIYSSFPDAATGERLRRHQERALMGRANVMALDDDPDGARELLQKLARIAKSSRAGVFEKLGDLERTLNENPRAAVDAYERSIAGWREVRDYPQEVAVRLTLAHYLAGKAGAQVPDARVKAAAQVAASEGIARQMQYRAAEWRVEFVRGLLAEAEQPKAAIERYRAAEALLDRLRGGIGAQELRQSLTENDWVQELNTRLIALLTRSGMRDEAWRFLERSKARSFLEMLGGRRMPSNAAAPEAGLIEMERQLANVRFQLLPDNAEVLRRAGREPAALRLEMQALEAKFAVAREQAGLLRSRSGQVFGLEPASLQQVQEVLERGAVLVEYGLLEGEVTAFVVTRAGADQVTWRADTNRLRRDVLRLRGLLANAQSTGWPELAAQVSKSLIGPIASKIPGDAQRLLVAPAAELNELPFSALTLPDGRFLIDAYAIGCLPSASSLLYLSPETPRTGELFLGALGAAAVDGLPPLPGTLDEIAGIAAAYPKAMRAYGEAFTRDAALHALESADTVHFATHALLDDAAPLFSALLTNATAGQPSRFSLYEIVGLKLRARMVVLSACETGLGKRRAGDEITGLTRTFLTAGADTVVASLWKVSDQSTATLMVEFYRRLARGMGPAAALRESALAVRAQYPHPFYWAPFVVTGRS